MTILMKRTKKKKLQKVQINYNKHSKHTVITSYLCIPINAVSTMFIACSYNTFTSLVGISPMKHILYVFVFTHFIQVGGIDRILCNRDAHL